MRIIPSVAIASVLAALVIGCAKNPVTGKNQFMLVNEQWELEVGKKYYAPMRQSQGGDYTADPEVERYVRSVGQKLAAVSDRKLPYEFNVINDSTPNAWALPGGKISINRGLLVELESEAELAAVLGHEIVHAAARHGASAQSKGTLSELAVVGVTVGLSNKLGSEGAQLVGAGAAGAAHLITQSYGRKAERESDEFGMLYMKRAGYAPQGAIGLQQKFVALSKSRGQASKFQQLFSSHPSSEARVAHNRETAARLGPEGEIGKKRYQQKMARIFKTKPAYAHYDSAIAAFEKGKKNLAKTLLQKAIAIEPKEAMFYSALGDMESEKKNYTAAKRHYDKAIGLNKQYYYPYLRRGEAAYRTGKNEAARQDLLLSNTLLPSSSALNLLGNLALKSKDQGSAKKYFKAAIQYGGASANSAYSNLLTLDLGSNPGSYIKATKGITPKGTLGIQISNPTPKNITGIVYSITSSSSGKSQKKALGTVLPAGKRTVVDTGLTISEQQLADVKVAVISARLAKK